MVNKLEFRTDFELRAVEEEDDELIIEGIVNNVGEYSKVLYGSFKEKIESGVFSRAIKKAMDAKRDIFFLAQHNNMELPLASIKSGTMELKEEDNKLKIRAKLPKTTLAQDIYKLCKAKVLREFSFGFNDTVCTWGKDEDGIRLRNITDFNLYEISIVTIGAYNNTDAQARSLQLSDILPKDDKSEEQRQHDEMYQYNLNKIKIYEG